jgi:hypothetical protein
MLRELVEFLVLENARELATAIRFSSHLTIKREDEHRKWQHQQAARNYHGNERHGQTA